ncbi:sensor histidine kinase [Tissierella sp.]|uniref:sensor histidine kinase n=1 Tax=Tissierella sp. TaxID=41274 RepID=UPI0028665D45|nr:sensor histidine kinase [Tissierella sp.]MDR7857769.1 sensor histidine kinase [Tissierella sp.]
MNKLWKYNNYLYIASRILIGIDVIYRCKNDTKNLLTYFGIFLFIVINDHLRMNLFYKDEKKYFISIFVTMIVSSLLIYNLGGYSSILMYIIIYELIIFTEGRTSRLLTGIEILLVFFIAIFEYVPVEELGSYLFWKDNILDILMSIVTLLFYAFMLFSYKTLRKEKREVDRLNKELELSYDKLKEQSEKIEELIITKERNRVAGEIHDNLGHSLIALNMNLDVAEKIIDKDVVKAKERISKSQILTKESMESLRKAVYALKEEKHTTLRSSLEEIVANIESSGNTKINLNIDEGVEELLPKCKDIIYSSIKEGLTNSIKHGKADKINIDVILEGDKSRVIIKDNGLGCNRLVKGNGLLGIEEKISKFGGRVNYSDEKDKGFEIELLFDNKNSYVTSL